MSSSPINRLLSPLSFPFLFALSITCGISAAQAPIDPDKIASIEVKLPLTIDTSRSGTLPEDSDSSFLLFCAGDTLRRGEDYSITSDQVQLLSMPTDTVFIIYRRSFPAIDRYYALRPFRTTREAELSEPKLPEPVAEKEAAPAGKLSVSGTKSFSADLSDRGNVNLSQGLALTLAGDIGHGIMVRGSFSDRGLRENRLVTKRFSELQNIYLEVESPQLEAKFGNFELREERFEYLGLVRNVQGLSVHYKADNYNLSTSLSVPPGNFATNSFTTAEGNFGPYELRGKNGESNVAVLENSETVWYNGNLLSRGRDEDYYVDYLRGELFFTGRVVVDEGDRVRMDFEYQKREYRKTLVTGAGSGRVAAERLHLDFGVATLTAAKDAPLDFALSDNDVAVLEAAGDDPARAVIPGARFVGAGLGDYSVGMDSLFGPIFRFVGDSLGDYQVSFSESDTGDYLYLGAGEYQFVGKRTGRYLPVKTVPLPEAAAVAAVAGQYQLSSDVAINSELAVSDYDRNRFSTLDDGDNVTIAGNVRASLGRSDRAVSGTIQAEYLPGDFYRFRRLDFVDEDYLWQRPATAVGDRQRYQANVYTNFGKHDITRWELGYTREGSDFRSTRAGFRSSFEDIARTRLDLGLDYAASQDQPGRKTLVRLTPTLTTRLLPVQIAVTGEYDNQQELPDIGQELETSRRELALTTSYQGFSTSVRQRENWSKVDIWQMLERKRTLRLGVDHRLSRRGNLNLDVLLNRVDAADGRQESYQTGTLDLLLPDIANFLDVSSRLRLNRRGRQQTKQTFLKVDEGEGDYVLVDSVYVQQSRGDFILVTEQVGTLSQTVEAEKEVRIDTDLEHLLGGVITRGTFFRYEVNIHEIGRESAKFREQWLLPPRTYFNGEPDFLTRRDEYRISRYDAGLGLKTELSYERRRQSNLLDISRPTQSKSDGGRLLFNKRIATRDFIELAVEALDKFRGQIGLFQLDIKKQSVAVKARKYVGFWELGALVETGREWTDSLDLRAVTYRFEPQASYSLTDIGRVTLSSFLLEVHEQEDRPVLREMADGFPEGMNFGGDLAIDFHMADNFDFKLAAHGEIRAGEKNRYYLRSELISRFK